MLVIVIIVVVVVDWFVVDGDGTNAGVGARAVRIDQFLSAYRHEQPEHRAEVQLSHEAQPEVGQHCCAAPASQKPSALRQ